MNSSPSAAGPILIIPCGQRGAAPEWDWPRVTAKAARTAVRAASRTVCGHCFVIQQAVAAGFRPGRQEKREREVFAASPAGRPSGAGRSAALFLVRRLSPRWPVLQSADAAFFEARSGPYSHEFAIAAIQRPWRQARLEWAALSSSIPKRGCTVSPGARQAGREPPDGRARLRRTWWSRCCRSANCPPPSSPISAKGL